MSWTVGLRLPGRIRIPLRLRVFFRGVFLLLALATVALAVNVLQEEKQLSWQSYRDGFLKNQAQIAARLRHPTGQLALLNPGTHADGTGPLHPLVLPFSAIDFDDRAKAQQAVEMAGCQVQYRRASLCVAVGNNPAAGGFIYVVGQFASGPLQARRPGELDLATAHRARVTVDLRGQRLQWLAPFEQAPGDLGRDTRGRLTGFVEGASGPTASRPVRDFRGWLWQDPRCMPAEGPAPAPSAASPLPAGLSPAGPSSTGPHPDEPATATASTEPPVTGESCLRRSFYSIRLPIDLFRDELYRNPQPVWPPADLQQIHVQVQMLAPGNGEPLFDSREPGATPPFSLADLTPLLLPGETLRIRRAGAPASVPDLVVLKGAEPAARAASPWLLRLIRLLPVERFDQPVSARETVATPLGSYELLLDGDLRSANRSLGAVASRVSWYVGAMLAAIVAAWAAIELRMIRRITLLTRRAATVSARVKGSEGLPALDLADLRSSDELGLLAGVLAELMQRINDDMRREQIRLAQEKDQWQAVGHEIMSPLQSLMVLHPQADDPSHRYITRMQQALRVLYGAASPSEAFEATELQPGALDLRAFLQHVADNAVHAGIAGVVFDAEAAGPADAPVKVRADEYSLEDVVTHVLRNADRYRPAGTPLTLTLTLTDTQAEVGLHNQGPAIPADQLERIFEYGVSDQPDAGAAGHRGQGLFVARTYMAKMGGTIQAENTVDGVRFLLRLQRVGGV